jgi:predicted aspartyl protease
MKTTLLLALLLLPATAQIGWSQSKPDRKVIEVPFELSHNEIVVAVKIGGKGPFSMLVDTDTDPSAIDLATARDLGLNMGSKGFPASGGGTEANVVYLTRLPLVELGDIAAKEVSAAAIDLSKIAGKLGRPIHGVLGYTFLRDRIVQIDYPASRIRFYSEPPYPPGIQYTPNTVNRVALTFRYEDGVLIDAVYVNGQKMRATLDTGSSGTFALTPDAVKMLALEEYLQDAQTEESVGYNGAYQRKIGVLKFVRIGRLSVDQAQATFWLPGTGHDHKKFQVNIGNGFLKDYVVTFDFRSKIVVLERPE